LRLGRDGWAGLAILLASLVLFWLTLGLKDSPLVPIGPGFYPRIVLGVTALLSAWLVVSDLAAAKPAAPALPVSYGMVALMFAVFGLYVLALPFLGFRVGTLVYVAAANALLDPPRGARGWGRVALVALLTSAATYLVFEHYLTVLMPRGSWTGF
jgi:putative tricarboxylic transport membrane protein